MMECKKDKCKLDIYKQLEEDILEILITVPEQRKASSWAYATSRKTLKEIMKRVKAFIEARK